MGYKQGSSKAEECPPRAPLAWPCFVRVTAALLCASNFGHFAGSPQFTPQIPHVSSLVHASRHASRTLNALALVRKSRVESYVTDDVGAGHPLEKIRQ